MLRFHGMHSISTSIMQQNAPHYNYLTLSLQGKRESLMKHLKSHSLDIVQLLMATLTRVEQLETKQRDSDATITTLIQRLNKADTENNEMEKKLHELEKSNRFGKNEDNQQRALSKYDSHHHSDEYEDPVKPNSIEKARLTSLIPLNSHLGNGTFSLAKWNDTGGSQDTRVYHMKEQIESHDTQLLKMSDSLQKVQSHMTQYAIAMDEVRMRQDILDVKTTNGILIWKISDIRRRFRDAVDGRTISLYSHAPFYTSPHGYRMCIRTYLNGDGIGKGTHLSLFFVLMHSEQDNLLPWPFKQSVRFTLINQKNPAASITEAFIPDTKSASFQKPENDMNVASGFPKFARQSVLQDENFTLGNINAE